MCRALIKSAGSASVNAFSPAKIPVTSVTTAMLVVCPRERIVESAEDAALYGI